MTESEFLTLIDITLSQIENTIEQIVNDTNLDIEYQRNGNILEIECIDNNSIIIINSQTFTQELWLATKSGGYHYYYDGIQWINTRDDSELFKTLSTILLQCT